ncbi:unnamed protein product [Alternaria alternata]
MNRKAWRKARKSATKTVGDIVVSDAEDQTAHTEGLSTEPRLAEDTIEYECCICRDDFPFSGGVAHCEEHFTCNSCVVDAYNAAIADIDAFPAQCCSPFPRPIVEHLLSPKFCFVCLQPWTSEGFHQDAGCPSYGDPEEGYDNEGYELGGRGLHRDTGYNRMGLNRFGQRQLSHAVVEESAASEHDQYSDNEDLDYDEYEIDYADEEQWVDDAQFGNNERADGIAPQDEIEWGEPAQGGRPWDEELDAEQDVQILNFDNSWRVELVPFTDEANPVEATIVTSWDLAPASQGHSQASPPPDSVREQIRLARRVPILAPNPHPEDSVFSGGTPSFQQLELSEQLEDELWADCDEDILGLATMLGVYETQLFELQPYLYWDFGIRLMFEELELQMRKDYCAVTEEDVGIPGLTLTFDLATNPFAPLHWDS